jgi:hypothetical protein
MNVRSYIVRVFPYSVIYMVDQDEIFIFAIAHAKRHPGYWMLRVP